MADDRTEDTLLLDDLDEEELTPEDLDEMAAEEESDATPAEPQEQDPYAGFGDNKVIMDGRTFVIEEPDLGAVLGIVRVIGQLLVRGERAALRQLQSISRTPNIGMRTVLSGLLASLQVNDLVALGAHLLQFEDAKEGRSWLKEHKMRLNPLVKALFLNLAQSEDLRESIQSFFVGMQASETTLTRLMDQIGM